jgi:HD-GYP domain-containing protein (c-di-GMP phosphodiesterase class II)
LLVLYQQQKETAERLAQAVEVTEATNRDLETANTELASKNRELEEANFSFAASLIVSLDARDHYTAGHSAAVAVYSRDVARRIGLDEEEQRRAYLAGLMHDIGKVGLPPGILEKPSALSPEEETMMQQHVLIGERILAPVRQFHDLAPAVRHHHERFDGVGYPDGLADENIPLLARLIAVADTYNAMTSDRPYRRALAPGDAIEQLRALAGTQLDPDVALAFVGVLTEADAAYRVARRNEFVIDFRNLGTSVPLAALTRS